MFVLIIITLFLVHWGIWGRTLALKATLVTSEFVAQSTNVNISMDCQFPFSKTSDTNFRLISKRKGVSVCPHSRATKAELEKRKMSTTLKT